jgi:hypothetical protein
MYKRSMTTQELQAWVELADTPEDMQERADAANAGYPEQVTVMDDGELMMWVLTHRDVVLKDGLLLIGETTLRHKIVARHVDDYASAIRMLVAQPDFPQEVM